MQHPQRSPVLDRWQALGLIKSEAAPGRMTTHPNSDRTNDRLTPQRREGCPPTAAVSATTAAAATPPGEPGAPVLGPAGDHAAAGPAAAAHGQPHGARRLASAAAVLTADPSVDPHPAGAALLPLGGEPSAVLQAAGEPGGCGPMAARAGWGLAVSGGAAGGAVVLRCLCRRHVRPAGAATGPGAPGQRAGDGRGRRRLPLSRSHRRPGGHRDPVAPPRQLQPGARCLP